MARAHKTPELKYKPEYCELLVEHMAKGLSFDAFAGEVRVRPGTLYDWAKNYQEFAEAKELGFARCRLFWEKLGVAGAAGRIEGFNTGTWFINMKNRFGWRDRQDIHVDGQVQHTHTVTEEREALLSDLKDILIKPNAPKLSGEVQ